MKKISINELIKVDGIGSKTIKNIQEHLREDDYISEYNPALHLKENSINNGDCLELMNGIQDKSVDMILADLPYGTTACSWDSVIDLEAIWCHYNRIIKDNGAIILTASQPFTTELINSNFGMFKYELIWRKNTTSGFALAHKRPMKNHENVLVFYKTQPTYNPIKELRRMNEDSKKRMNYDFNTLKGENQITGIKKVKYNPEDKDLCFPKSVQEIDSISSNSKERFHPTQKPAELFEYLIKTYTDENDLVLDNVSGSGTTAVAAINTNRKYICIEKDKEYYEKSLRRIIKLDNNK